MGGNKTHKNLTAIIVTSFVFAGSVFAFSAFASTTDGTIDPTGRYGWTENAGWLDFGATEGDVHVTDSALTGYAWGENIGWIRLDPAYGGVINDGEGNLSGYAWGENIGWINFNPTYGGVTINSSGEFLGYAWGENIGWIIFNCFTTDSCLTVDYKVKTDWRPASARVCTSWTYSDWSSCASSRQTRTVVSSSPSGCSGGSPVLTQSCSSGGGGLPSGFNAPLIIPPSGFEVNINPAVSAIGSGQSATISSSRIVTLDFSVGADVKKMAISLTGDFSDASQEDYQPNIRFDLCSRYAGAAKAAICPDGTYTIYVKFYNAGGVASPVISDSIVLQTGNASPASPQSGAAPTAPPANVNPASPPSAVKASASFVKILSFGQINGDIKKLQIFLNQDPATRVARSGPGSPGKETNIFGWNTRAAVIKFQEKYAKEILSPWKLTRGTGLVGPTTLKKINELIGKISGQ
jgi:hypothetical protein